jgi:hypothetical protein
MPNVQPYTQNERRALDSILEPTGKTLEQLAQQITNYSIVHAQASQILATDRPRRTQLFKELRESPVASQITFIDAQKPTPLGPRGLGIHEYQDRPEELWEMLSQYDDFIRQEPQTFEE